ncbi:MAG TPA: transketolase C-terminal domain-containing protein [Patescibacteria group bacterium]
MINYNLHLIEDIYNAEKIPMRDGYGNGILEAAKRDGEVVALVADLTDSLKLEAFKKEYPGRFWEMGIQEQNMMGVAAGMAASGKVPFVNSFACFNPGRNWEQLRVAVCLSRNNVKVIGGHSGFGNGVDGTNQQSFEDLAITRVIPNLVVVAPVDSEQARKATIAIAEYIGPVYMRITKPARPVVTSRITPFEIGKAQVMREGKDITLAACGAMVYEALEAAENLKDRVDVEVINVHTIKPMDVQTLVRSVKKTGRIITAEEHSIIGGLGGAVAEVLGEHMPVPMLRMGMKDRFGESGDPGDLLEKYGLSSEEMEKNILKMLD